MSNTNKETKMITITEITGYGKTVYSWEAKTKRGTECSGCEQTRDLANKQAERALSIFEDRGA